MLLLHVMGEPMYHPQLNEFLQICEKHSQNVGLVTNGILLNEENQQVLLSPSIFQVNFSLQSFESNYPGKDNKSYLERIFRFIKRAFEERPDMHINLRLWNAENFDTVLKNNKTTISRIQECFQIPDETINNLSLLGNRLKNNLFSEYVGRF